MVDEDGQDLVVGELAGAADAAGVLALFEAARGVRDVPLVDEAEERRLASLAAGEAPAQGWRGVVARSGELVLGYGGLLVPRDGQGHGDVGVDPRSGDRARVRRALLEALVGRAATGGAVSLTTWVRDVDEQALAGLTDPGHVVQRRLGVLGRDLADAPPVVAPPAGTSIRAYRPDVDDVAVVGVLAAAYAGTQEEGWDPAAFRERRTWPWFRAADLLLAVDDRGRVLGLHWLKRRSPTLGEVHNLAVAPDAQGRGLGPALLTAGLAHLHRVGCRGVLLWVDLANHPAVSLYRRHGFDTVWMDAALACALPQRVHATEPG